LLHLFSIFSSRFLSEYR